MKKALLSLFITLAIVNTSTATCGQEYIDLTAGTFSGEWGDNDRRSVWTSENSLTITAKDANGNEVGSMKYLNGFQLQITGDITTPIEYTITVPEGYTLTSMKFKNGYRNYNMTVDYGLRSYNLAGGTTEQEIIFTEDNYSFQLYGDNRRFIYITELVMTKIKDEEVHKYDNNTGFCTECGHFNTSAKVVELRDGEIESFNLNQDVETENLTYIRSLPNLDWNPLYVPFEIPVETLLEEYDIAYMNNMHAYDENEDGEIDLMEMEIFMIKTGVLKANYPYFIRAKSETARELKLCYENIKLHSTTTTSISCSSVYTKFEITGTYNTICPNEFDEINDKDYYTIAINGVWETINKNFHITPFRFYLTKEDLPDTPIRPNAIQRIHIVTRGENNDENTTLIDDIDQRKKTETTYDLQGRNVNKISQKGIYIINGKKVICK